MKPSLTPGFLRITDLANRRIIFAPLASTALEVFFEDGRLNVMGPSMYIPFNITEIMVEVVSPAVIDEAVTVLIDEIYRRLAKEVSEEEDSEATTE